MNFKNKIVWITGASSGIGKELAIQLSQKGCKLILSSRNREALEAVKSKCQNPELVAVLPLDLIEYNNMEIKVKEAISLFDGVDILINNGGISQRSLIADTSIEVDKKLMEVDYLGTIALSKALLPHFVEQQSGYFVTVTSVMGKFSSPYRSAYCAAKHALHGFFDALRMEHEKEGIKVSLICPGFVNTNIARSALTGDGSPLGKQDRATHKGLSTDVFCKRMMKAMGKQKFEAYIGRKEVLGVYLKRFFPKLLHRFVMKSAVR